MLPALKAWSAQEQNGLKDFLKAQLKVAVVLAVAHYGNVYEPAYPRNDNHAPSMFWLVNGLLAIATWWTWSWKASSASRSGGSPRVVILGRDQTEEWKGWMQWAFIFYHYYRVYYVYNEIRVFVSAYVWMVSDRYEFAKVFCLMQCCIPHFCAICLAALISYDLQPLCRD